MRREKIVIRRNHEDGFQSARMFYFLTWMVNTEVSSLGDNTLSYIAVICVLFPYE